MLAKWIVRQRWPGGLAALEVGCGLGLPGIAALSMGVKVTFSDFDATALRFASDNAILNGFSNFDVLHMDWEHPPEGLSIAWVAAGVRSDLRNAQRGCLWCCINQEAAGTPKGCAC